MESSRFINNTAENAGSIHVSNHNMKIQNWYFESNKATLGDGGSLYISCPSPSDNCEFYVYQNSFINNTAYISGGAIKWNDIRPYNLSNNIYDSNSALYGNDIASYPIALGIINEDSRRLEDKALISNVASG